MTALTRPCQGEDISICKVDNSRTSNGSTSNSHRPIHQLCRYRFRRGAQLQDDLAELDSRLVDLMMSMRDLIP